MSVGMVGLPSRELEQLVQLFHDLVAAALAETGGDAGGEVAFEQDAVELVEGALDGVGLLENVDAVLVLLDHLANAFNVALDIREPVENVFLFRLHAGLLDTQPPWGGSVSSE